MNRGICHFCGQQSELRNSHAIPRSFIRDISRQDSGKMVHLSSGNEPAKRLGDRSQDRLLCHECEQTFGDNFDRPLKELFAELRRKYRAGESHLILCDGAKIKNAIASVLWRAAISNAEYYKGFKPPRTIVETLREDVSRMENFSFSYRIQPIFDPNSASEGGLDDGAIDTFLLTPRIWGARSGFRGRQKTRTGMIFIMGGVVVDVIEKLSKSRERKLGHLTNEESHISLRATNLWEIPAVKEFLRWAVWKEHNPDFIDKFNSA